MISVPYSIELNDIPLFLDKGARGADFEQMARDHFDLLYEEAARRGGNVMSIALHPFLINQPSRHRYLDRFLGYVKGHDDVWFATSDDIADWYLEHAYDDAIAALAAGRRADVGTDG
jgi:hypothetical protein